MEETLKQEILGISDRLNKMSGANATEFIVHCGKSVQEVIGNGFEIADYSYEVISTNKLLETRNKDGSFQSDIWVTIKPPNKACGQLKLLVGKIIRFCTSRWVLP